MLSHVGASLRVGCALDFEALPLTAGACAVASVGTERRLRIRARQLRIFEYRRREQIALAARG